MLRTNCKEVRETVRNYITEGFNEEYADKIPTNEKELAEIVLDCFYNEKVKFDKRRMTEYELFVDWMQGLCGIIDSMYYYNVSAIDLLGNWLQETEEEKSKFSEEQAEGKITYLIYRELKAMTR